MADVIENMDIESGIKTALNSIESFRTPDCLDINTIGQYAEHKLSGPQLENAEEHLHACLYCLKQLNDMTELLYYDKHPLSVPRKLKARLLKLVPRGKATQKKNKSKISLFDKLKDLLSFDLQQWRFSAIGLATACTALLISIVVMRNGAERLAFPAIDSRAIVKVQALGDGGNVLKEEQGFVFGKENLIASNLAPLEGASKLKIILKDGSSYQTCNLWKDEEKNLAVMKIGDKGLTSIPISDIKEIIGKRIYAVSDPTNRAKGVQLALVSDIKEITSRRKEAGPRYIQVATQTSTASKGVVVDEQGRMLGILITEEKHLNLAASVDDIMKVATTEQVPVSDIKKVTFSGDAINFYIKGILARDGQRWDEAIKSLRQAIKLNPMLDGAYDELAYAYYRKSDFENESATYQEALRHNPRNEDALYGLGWNMESRGRYLEAIPYYERALELVPDDKELIYQLGISYLAQGRRDKSLELYEKLKRYDPGQAELLRRLIK